MKNAILLGTGALSWLPVERRSDRYGSVFMSDKNSQEGDICQNPITYTEALEKWEGTKGELLCEVLEIRESTHIGDLFRGIFPSTPAIGDTISLGTGKLFNLQDQEHTFGFNVIGLEPEDGRDTDWLNVENLYKVHEQTVNLYFLPEITDKENSPE